MKQHIIDRFYTRYTKDPDTGCWEWTAAKSVDGYGVINTGNKTMLAHRMSATLAGMDIKNKHVRHKCDNPGCVNPDHLDTGTQADNMKDREVRNRAGWKLTQQDVLDIRSDYVPGKIRQTDLAERYGVHVDTIRNVLHNKSWRYA